MEDFKKLNVAQICSITSYLKLRSGDYDFRKAKTFPLFWKKEGFYYNYTLQTPYLVPKEWIEREGLLYCEGENVFHKPFLQIRMSNNRSYQKYFNTEAELFEFMAEIKMKGVTWVDR